MNALIAYGFIDSPVAKCAQARTINIFAHFPDGSKELVDVAIRDVRGFFVGGGDFTGADGLIARVTKRNIGSKRRPEFCLAASKSYP